jgi:PAS domain S-box-containing protein
LNSPEAKSSTGGATDPVQNPSRIQGTGEMADLFRAKDWSTTPLGAVETWSETLLATVNIMLLSPLSFAVYWGAELTLLYNDVYRLFLGAKHPEALGTPGPTVWVEAWPIIGLSILATLTEGKTTNETEALIPILTDGQLQDRWWTYGLYPLFENSRVVGVANPGTDVTTGVITRKALQESEARVRLALVAANAVGTWDWDVSKDLVYADERFAKLYGVDPEVAKRGTTIQEFFRNIHPDDFPRTSQLIDAVMHGKADFSAEYRVVLKDGSVRWVSALGRCSYDEAGRPTRFPGVSVDITEKKKRDEALIRTEKLAAVGKLASSIAHEINNPLEAVTNLLYLARMHDSSNEVKQYLDLAEQELRRVSSISTQTLRFHKQLSNPVEVSCEELFTSVLNIFTGRIRTARIQIEKRKRAQRNILCFDGEIRQVLNNLVGNAIDALQLTGGGRLLLRSREGSNWRTGAEGLILTVADSAGGMAPESLKQVFEPFFTTKGISGTGLGLWVSEEIVHRHGGVMRVKSSNRPGRSGTVFALFLPFEAVIRD